MFDSIVEWVEAVLGTYTPVTYQVSKILDGQEVVEDIIPAGFAGLDWRYIITACFLLITVYSVFRLLGVLLERIGGR